MKIFHLSDLHIGKQLHYYNLKKNQQAILHQIVERALEYAPDAILICGDIFDKSVPSAEAYTLFDDFLNELSERVTGTPILLIAGNHDSAQRLNYASSFLEKHHIYVSVLPPQQEGEHLKKIELQDEWGTVSFYLLPFLKPGYVRHLFEDGAVTDYDSAVREILAREHIDYTKRNVLLSHQFYSNGEKKPELCESETAVLSIGGLDNIDVSVIEQFDYAALGHIHGAQMVKSPHIRYCGTPLKYSVSEEHHKKSITMVTLGKKGEEPVIETIPLVPIQEVRREKGTLKEILERATKENCHDFVSITMTDEKEPYNPKEQLEEVYDNILELRIENSRTKGLMEEKDELDIQLQPMEIFRSFYEEMNQQTMSGEEEAIVSKIINQCKEEEA